jgi:hypothetical protein
VRLGDDWMISAVFDRDRKPIATAGKRGVLAVAEFDLGQLTVGPNELGGFRWMVPRHCPVAVMDERP